MPIVLSFVLLAAWMSAAACTVKVLIARHMHTGIQWLTLSFRGSWSICHCFTKTKWQYCTCFMFMLLHPIQGHTQGQTHMTAKMICRCICVCVYTVQCVTQSKQKLLNSKKNVFSFPGYITWSVTGSKFDIGPMALHGSAHVVEQQSSLGPCPVWGFGFRLSQLFGKWRSSRGSLSLNLVMLRMMSSVLSWPDGQEKVGQDIVSQEKFSSQGLQFKCLANSTSERGCVLFLEVCAADKKRQIPLITCPLHCHFPEHSL